MSDREEEEEEVPQLSAAALAALQEFYAENEAGHSALGHGYTVGGIKEDWVRARVVLVLKCTLQQHTGVPWQCEEK